MIYNGSFHIIKYKSVPYNNVFMDTFVVFNVYWTDHVWLISETCPPAPPGEQTLDHMVAEESKCMDMICTLVCPHGLARDENDCQVCRCAVPWCATSMCSNYCPDGYSKNEMGCDTCDCVEKLERLTVPSGAEVFLNLEVAPGVELLESLAISHTVKCTELLCTLECANGRILDENNCELCQCRPLMCAASMCANHCLNGYKKNDEGCDTCDCVELLAETDIQAQPIIQCPVITCNSECTYGKILDRNGCETCQCRSHTCAVPMCANRCAGGYRKNSMGCDTCQCVSVDSAADHSLEALSQCDSRACTLECQFGRVIDENNCELCECKLPICAIPMCANICPNGYSKNEMGCDTCDCIGNVETQGADSMVRCRVPVCFAPCPFGSRKTPNGCETCDCLVQEDIKVIEQQSLVPCHEISCTLECTFGRVLDENNCELCECNPPICAIPMCANVCPNGYNKNEMGCGTCDCIENVQIPNSAEHLEIEELRQCPNISCTLECPFGRILDENNCETCQCKSPRCPTTMCANRCPGGYRRNEQGCDTCECSEGQSI